MRRAAATLGLALALAAAPGRQARAGAVEVGNLFAGPTEPGGGSTFLNPAALTRARGTNLWVEGGLTLLGLSYDRAGTDPATGEAFASADGALKVPLAAAALSSELFDSRLRAGLGITIPFVEGARWPETVQAGSTELRGPTVYHAHDVKVFSVFTTPAVAWELSPKVQIGAGFNAVYTRLDKLFSTDMATQVNALVGDAAFANEDPALAAPSSMHGSGMSYGWTAGLQVAPIPSVRVAASYTSATTAHLDSELTIGDAPVLDAVRQELRSRRLELTLAGTGEVVWKTPQVVNAGISVRPRGNVQLVGDFQWTDLSEVGVMNVSFTERSNELVPEALVAQKLRTDDYRITGRAVWGFRPGWRGVLRTSYDTDAVPEQVTSPANLDFPTIAAGLGLEWTLSRDVRVGADFTHFIILARDVDESLFVESPDAVTAFSMPSGAGHYAAHADRFGLSLRWRL